MHTHRIGRALGGARVVAWTLCGLAPCAAGQERWSEAFGNAGPHTDITIAAGQEVLFDVASADVGAIAVHGVLRFEDDEDIQLTADEILISGQGALLEIGTPAAPFTHRLTLTLDQTISAEQLADRTTGNYRRLMVAGGGSLRIHGVSAAKESWTQIEGHLLPGDTQMTLVAPTGWEPGDELVVAPTGFDPDQAEVVTIGTVSADGLSVSFLPPLAFEHFGAVETYAGRALDMRAEVGLLTRNVVLRGPDDAEQTRVGAHTMVMPSAGPVKISGVRFDRMGQVGRQGRYAMHWHRDFSDPDGRDKPGDSIARCSFTRTLQRAVVVHGHNGILVAENVAYDTSNHVFVPSEDGVETGNVFIGNLSVLSRSPAYEDYAFPGGEEGAQQERRSSGFWLRNWGNTLIGNRVAGAFSGMGFFYDSEDTDGPLGEMLFLDNKASGCFHTTIGPVNYPPNTRGHGLFARTQMNDARHAVFDGFTAFKNRNSGIWMERERQEVREFVSADNGINAWVIKGALRRGVLVADTGNDNGEWLSPGPDTKGSLTILGQQGMQKSIVTEDLTFHGVREAAIKWNDTTLEHDSVFAGLTFLSADGGPRMLVRDNAEYGSFLDGDGSLSGTGLPTHFFRIADELARIEGVSVTDAEGFSQHAPAERYGLLDIQTVRSVHSFDDAMFVRDDGVSGQASTPRWHWHGARLEAQLPRQRVYDLTQSNELAPYVELRFDTTATGRLDADPDGWIEVGLQLPAGRPYGLLAGSAVEPSADLQSFRSAAAPAHVHDAASGRVRIKLADTGLDRVLLTLTEGLAFGDRDEVLPADSIEVVGAGVSARTYLYPWDGSTPVPAAETLDALEPIAVGIVDDALASTPGAEGFTKYASLRSGYLEVRTPGLYAFETSDRISVSIAGALFVPNNSSGQIALDAGRHAFEIVELFRNGQGTEIRWSGPTFSDERLDDPTRFFLGTPVVTQSCSPADIDGDGAVSFADVTAFIGAFEAGSPAADIDGDGAVSFGDAAAFIADYNAGCP